MSSGGEGSTGSWDHKVDVNEDTDISESDLDKKIGTYRSKRTIGKKRRSSSENKRNENKKKWKTAIDQSDDTEHEDDDNKRKTKSDKGVHGKSKPRGRAGSSITVRCPHSLMSKDVPRVNYLDKKVMLSILKADVIDKDRWGRLNYINTLLEDEPGGDGIPEDARGGGVYDDLMKKHIETRRKKLSAMADCFRASNKCAVDVLDCLDKHGNDIRNIASGSSTSLAERTPIRSQPAEPEAQYAHHVQIVVNQTAPTGGTSTEDLLAERPDVNTPWHVDGRGIVYMDRSRVFETSGEQQEDVSDTDILAKSTIANADTHTSAAGYSNGGVKNDPIWENRTAHRDNSGINMAPVEIGSTTDIDVDDVPANNNNTAIVMLGDVVSWTEAYNNISGHPVDNMSREDQPMFQAHVQTPDALVNEAIEAGSASVSVEGGVRTPVTRSKTNIKSYKRSLKNVLSAPLPIYAPAMFMYKKDAHLVRRFILNGSVLDKHGE
ncbi:hypothetical protein ACQ4PT_034786 [Festuca glaucescens]